MSDADFDAIVVGAGFSGLYALHRLREQGLRVRILEKADAVGGTWLVNRYPGARCDIESIEYSYSFSDEIQQEWVWTETMPAQPEIEAYLNFVADRLDLRRDIAFGTEVVTMTFDEATSLWAVTTADGQTLHTPFVVTATGILSVPLEPDIPGMGRFTGASLFTSRWPREGVDLTGKRVGVIGTGSTGVQLIPVVAGLVDCGGRFVAGQRGGGAGVTSGCPGRRRGAVHADPGSQHDDRDAPGPLGISGAAVGAVTAIGHGGGDDLGDRPATHPTACRAASHRRCLA